MTTPSSSGVNGRSRTRSPRSSRNWSLAALTISPRRYGGSCSVALGWTATEPAAQVALDATQVRAAAPVGDVAVGTHEILRLGFDPEMAECLAVNIEDDAGHIVARQRALAERRLPFFHGGAAAVVDGELGDRPEGESPAPTEAHEWRHQPGRDPRANQPLDAAVRDSDRRSAV